MPTCDAVSPHSFVGSIVGPDELDMASDARPGPAVCDLERGHDEPHSAPLPAWRARVSWSDDEASD